MHVGNIVCAARSRWIASRAMFRSGRLSGHTIYRIASQSQEGCQRRDDIHSLQSSLFLTRHPYPVPANSQDTSPQLTSLNSTPGPLPLCEERIAPSTATTSASTIPIDTPSPSPSPSSYHLNSTSDYLSDPSPPTNSRRGRINSHTLPPSSRSTSTNQQHSTITQRHSTTHHHCTCQCSPTTPPSHSQGYTDRRCSWGFSKT